MKFGAVLRAARGGNTTQRSSGIVYCRSWLCRYGAALARSLIASALRPPHYGRCWRHLICPHKQVWDETGELNVPAGLPLAAKPPGVDSAYLH
jgi:hypothetical protein